MRVFVSPLDWGLGHAARCVPVINYLLEKKVEVIIGAEGPHLFFLKERFLSAEFVEFPGYRISYSGILPANMKVLLQVPNVISAIRKEHDFLNEWIESKKIDAVISDNRYGLWSKKIPSVIITHQLNIQAPAGKNLLNKTIHNHINRFDECWVPDYAGEQNLSGSFSHPIPKGINATYIGPLSRFNRPTDYLKKKQYDLFVILSGPEPQRTIWENTMLHQLKNLPHIKAFIVQGLPGHKPPERNLENVEIAPHLSDKEFLNKINSSEIIISRPGYSTIMDLYITGWEKSIFTPTPGQTEQEYLGNLMQKKGWAITYKQKEFLLQEAIEKAKALNPILPELEIEFYKTVIYNWLQKIGVK